MADVEWSYSGGAVFKGRIALTDPRKRRAEEPAEEAYFGKMYFPNGAVAEVQYERDRRIFKRFDLSNAEFPWETWLEYPLPSKAPEKQLVENEINRFHRLALRAAETFKGMEKDFLIVPCGVDNFSPFSALDIEGFELYPYDLRYFFKVVGSGLFQCGDVAGLNLYPGTSFTKLLADGHLENFINCWVEEGDESLLAFSEAFPLCLVEYINGPELVGMRLSNQKWEAADFFHRATRDHLAYPLWKSAQAVVEHLTDLFDC